MRSPSRESALAWRDHCAGDRSQRWFGLGKSGIVRCLQAVLPDPWPALRVDSFVDALPARMRGADAGITLAADGAVSVGPQ